MVYYTVVYYGVYTMVCYEKCSLLCCTYHGVLEQVNYGKNLVYVHHIKLRYSLLWYSYHGILEQVNYGETMVCVYHSKLWRNIP